MNLSEIQREFGLVMRSIGESDFDEATNQYINAAWSQIAEMFVIPALNKSVTFSSVVDQSTYLFPYDYNGAEFQLYHDGEQLSPVAPDVLALVYEKRTGSKGRVMYYAWNGISGLDPLAELTVQLVNESKTVLCATASVDHIGLWVRFDPFTSPDATVYNPGDYGYKIVGATANTSYTLDREYRGPDILTANMVVQPSETQSFSIFGTPTAIKDMILGYSSRPRRLYNPSDVPEWPNMGSAITYLAVSTALDYLQRSEQAKTWFARAMARVKSLQSRKDLSNTLVTDMVIGSVHARRTGLRPVYTGRYVRR